MDVYLDLTIILEVFILLGTIILTFSLNEKKCKKRYIPLLVIFLSLSVYLYNTNIIIVLLVRFITVTIFFILEDKKQFIKNIILYLIEDLLFRVITSFFVEKTIFYNGLLLITDYKGCLSYLVVIFLIICIFISTKFVDYVYRLSSFKTDCFITYSSHKFYASAYFDTGNTLKYMDIPVVFTSVSNFPYKVEKYEEIEVTTINGTRTFLAVPCLLSIENNKESMFIYLAFIEEYKLFHGCEVLLNAYLL